MNLLKVLVAGLQRSLVGVLLDLVFAIVLVLASALLLGLTLFVLFTD